MPTLAITCVKKVVDVFLPRMLKNLISVLANATSKYITHMRILYHKSCLVTFHIPSCKTHPGKVLWKLIYIVLIENYT